MDQSSGFGLGDRECTAGEEVAAFAARPPPRPTAAMAVIAAIPLNQGFLDIFELPPVVGWR
jgi:hypothetical protein